MRYKSTPFKEKTIDEFCGDLNRVMGASKEDYRITYAKHEAIFAIERDNVLGKERPSGLNYHLKHKLTRLSYIFNRCDVVLLSIKPVNAGQSNDHLIARGLASTLIRRVLSSVKAIYNLASKELGITNPNPFAGISIPEDNTASERLPVTLHSMCSIQRECSEVNDPQRWLFAIICETGMRFVKSRRFVH